MIHCANCGSRAGAEGSAAGALARGRHLRSSPAIRSTVIRPGSTSHVRNAAARRRARPTRWTRSSIRPGISRASPIRGTRTRRSRARSPIAGCRSTNISAASSTRFCICSIRASSRAAMSDTGHVGSRRAVRRPLHAGHGRARDLSRRRRRVAVSRPRWTCEGDGGPPRLPSRDRRAGRDRPDREDVEVEAATRSTPTTSLQSYGADTARWFMLSDSPPERDVIWTEEGVQGAARFVQRLWRLVGDLKAAARGGRRPRDRGERSRAARSARRPIALIRSATTSSGCASTAASRTSTSSPTPCTDALDEIEQRRRRGRPWRRLARGRRHPGPAFRADDAASGRGMLGGSRPERARGRGALAGGRSDLARRGHVSLPVQVNGKSGRTS